MKIEVVALIYQSTKFLKFIDAQLKEYAHADGHQVSYRIVANDPTAEVEAYLVDNDIPHKSAVLPERGFCV